MSNLSKQQLESLILEIKEKFNYDLSEKISYSEQENVQGDHGAVIKAIHYKGGFSEWPKEVLEYFNKRSDEILDRKPNPYNNLSDEEKEILLNPDYRKE